MSSLTAEASRPMSTRRGGSSGSFRARRSQGRGRALRRRLAATARAAAAARSLHCYHPRP